MEPAKTNVYAVCIAGKTGGRSDILRGTIQSFKSQVYAGQKRLVVVTDRRIPELEAKDPEVTYVFIPRKCMLGELRNAAKTWVAQQIIRDKRAYYMCHWDEGDYRHPDFLNYMVRQMEVQSVAMLTSAIHVDLLTGNIIVKTEPAGVHSTLLYSPFLRLGFDKIQQNVTRNFVNSLTSPPPMLKKTFLLPNLQVVSNDTHLIVRFYDGHNAKSQREFMLADKFSRPATDSETAYVKLIMEKYVTNSDL